MPLITLHTRGKLTSLDLSLPVNLPQQQPQRIRCLSYEHIPLLYCIC